MLLAGEVGKPHGTAGEVYVLRISDDPHRFDAGARLWHADGRELVVEESRTHRDRLLIKFEGIETRDAAATLRGGLFVRAQDRRELDDSEFWVGDLVGSSVVLPNGASVGRVKDVITGEAQDLLVVETEAGERMVPLVKEIVTEVDVDSRRVVVDPPEGLL